MEAFLIDILSQNTPARDLHTPAGLTLAFERFLHSQFKDRPQRIALASVPSAPSGVWMSVDEFFEALRQK